MDNPSPAAYEFGEFRLVPGARRLTRGEQPVALTPKVLDALTYLVVHRDRVVPKDELMAALWPDAVVEENNLGQAVSRLRSALGEAPGDNRYIATIPGRGYRFVADVHVLAEAARPDAAEPRNLGTVPPAASGRRRLWILSAAIAIVAVGVIAAFLIQGRASRAPVDQPPRRLAVLPFKPLVADSRDEAMEFGMAESLIAKLSTIEQLRVAPLAAVRRYHQPDDHPARAGRALDVDAVLEGHIHRAGDRIRITARLVRVEDEKQLWAGRYDQTFTDIFAIQDAISAQVARELSLRLTEQQRMRVMRRETSDPQAYELYLKGRFFMSLAQPRNAIAAFEEAARRDPRFALALAGLADIYSRLPMATDGPSIDVMTRARAAAMAALEADDRLSEAHAALGWISFYYDWNWRASAEHFQRALEIDPQDFSAHLGYAHLLSNTLRHEEAIREVERALAADPHSPIAGALKAQFLFYAGRSDQADAQVRHTLDTAPGFWIGHVVLGRLKLHEGRYAEAAAAFSVAAKSGGTWAPLALLGFTHAAAGGKEDARRILDELTQAPADVYVPPYYVALTHHAVGNDVEALSWLERAYREKDVRMVFLGVEPLWGELRQHERFVALVSRMNFGE